MGHSRWAAIAAVVGIIVGCGGGGAVTAPDPAFESITDPLTLGAAFTVRGRGFPDEAVTVRFVSKGSTPFLGGTSNAVETAGAVRSATSIEGATPSAQATGDVRVYVELLFAGGTKITSIGDVTTLVGPRLDRIEPDVFDATQATPFVLHGSGFDVGGPSPVLRVMAITGTAQEILVPVTVQDGSHLVGTMSALTGPSGKLMSGETGWFAATLTVAFAEGHECIHDSFPPPNCEFENLADATAAAGPELLHTLRFKQGRTEWELEASGYSWSIAAQDGAIGQEVPSADVGPLLVQVPQSFVTSLHGLVVSKGAGEVQLDVTLSTSEVTSGDPLEILRISLVDVVVDEIANAGTADAVGEILLALHAAEVRIQAVAAGDGADATWNFETWTGSPASGGLVPPTDEPELTVRIDDLSGGGEVDGLRSYLYRAGDSTLELEVAAPGAVPGLFHALLRETNLTRVVAFHGPPAESLELLGSTQTWWFETGRVMGWSVQAAQHGAVEMVATLAFEKASVEVEPYDAAGEKLAASSAGWGPDPHDQSSFASVGLGAQSADDLAASPIYYEHLLEVEKHGVPLTHLAWSVQAPPPGEVTGGGGARAEAGSFEIGVPGGGWVPGLFVAAHEGARLGRSAVRTHDRWGRERFLWTLADAGVLQFENEARRGVPAEIRVWLEVSDLTLDAYGHADGATGPPASQASARLDFEEGVHEGAIVLPPVPSVEPDFEGLLVTLGADAPLLRDTRSIRWGVERVGPTGRSEVEVVALPDVAMPGLLVTVARIEPLPTLTVARRRPATADLPPHVPFALTLTNAQVREMTVRFRCGWKPTQAFLVASERLEIRTEDPEDSGDPRALTAEWDFERNTGSGDTAFSGATLDDVLLDRSNADDRGILSLDGRDHVVVESFAWSGRLDGGLYLSSGPTAVSDAARFELFGSHPAAGLLAAVMGEARADPLLLRWYAPGTADPSPDPQFQWQVLSPRFTRAELISTREGDTLAFEATGGAVRFARYRLEPGQPPFRVAQVDWDPVYNTVQLGEWELPGPPEHHPGAGEPSYVFLRDEMAWAEGVFAYGSGVSYSEETDRPWFDDVEIRMPAGAFSPRWIAALVEGEERPQVEIDQWVLDERRSTLTLRDALVTRYAMEAAHGTGVVDTLGLAFEQWVLVTQEYDPESEGFLPPDEIGFDTLTGETL